jgi:hypothetical protein
MNSMGIRGGDQFSSGTCSFVMAAVTFAHRSMEEPAVFGQICHLQPNGQAGTGFAHLGR